MNIYCVNGIRGAGKTTFEQFCYALNPIYVRQYSSIDLVKRIASGIGWDGTKGDKDRKFLANLKQLLIEYDDIPFKDVCAYIRRQARWCDNRDLDSDKLIFFIDVREPEEIEKFKSGLNAQTILLRRAPQESEVETLSKGDSTSEILGYKYDFVIENAGDLDALKVQARTFMEQNKLILGYKL